ncbi:type-4 ice-structuring protein LS-12-like [Chanos chanos]|uniref:Type-4 ice-structuring protein LS-12-like n=1 Tax=Chanos chanos TaxID=29144 RepID=A0A6J2W135_CHACN|nr:type-4 ice-structuring protein LS-12-like [Chanos chanos]
MKFSLIAALVVVLAIAHGTESMSVVKREAPAELEKITQYFEGLLETLKSADAPELANKAKAYFEESKAKLQPMVEKLQEQLKPLSGNLEEQIKPIADSVQAQLAPYASLVQSQVEDVLKFVVDQTKAILPAPSQ